MAKLLVSSRSAFIGAVVIIVSGNNFAIGQSAPALLASGREKMSRQDFEGAVKDLTRFTELQPKSEVGHHLLGNALIKCDEGNKAIEQYTLSIALNERTQAYFDRGEAWFAAREYSKAIADFEQSLRVQIQVVKSLRHEGECYIFQKRYPEAIAIYDKLISMEKNPRFFLSRGYCLEGMKKYELAVDDLSSAIKLDPNIPAAYLERAKIYKLLGQAALAQADTATAGRMASKMEADLFPHK